MPSFGTIFTLALGGIELKAIIRHCHNAPAAHHCWRAYQHRFPLLSRRFLSLCGPLARAARRGGKSEHAQH
jgi:hypothetical protein